MHIPQDLCAIGAALEVACNCLGHAAGRHKDKNLDQWKSVADTLNNYFKGQAANGSPAAARWFRPPTSHGTPQDRLSTWRISMLPTESEKQLAVLIGLAIANAASINGSVSPALINGAHILKNALAGKGRRSPGWNTLTDIDLLDSSSLSRIFEGADPRAVHFPFIASTLLVLRSSIGSPFHSLLDPSQEKLSEKNDPDNAPQTVAIEPNLTEGNESSDLEQEEGPRSREDLHPDIGARLSSSDYTTFAEKLGFVTRNYLDPDGLALVTRKLVQHLQSDNQEHSTYALFSLVSLLTGCSDFIASKLRFEPGHSIWLDADAGTWCWAFSAYRNQRDPTDAPAVAEPISVPLPVELTRRLRHLRVTHPAASTLSDLMSAALGSPLDLKKFREFLRGCGDPVHPAYASRFAKSMPLVFLRTCASDMSAAMLSGHFAVAAPAALFYYGPTYGVLRQRLCQTYAFLGLDEPIEIGNQERRAGCQKVLEVAPLHAGWGRFIAEIDRIRTSLTSALSDSARQEDLNQLMTLLCAGFVIQTAHRGTRLERLTFGAMFLHEEAVLISDKDEFDREQPRLIPKTPIVKQLLLAAADLHYLIKPDRSTGFEHDTCLFVQWGDSFFQQPAPVTTSAIARVIGEFFADTDVNFGRSAWVTHLDEDGCDRWLIRTLTGHTRDVTRTNGAYFDIPPIKAARKLADAMIYTGHRLFGTTALSHGKSESEISFRVSGRVRPMKDAPFKVPDPRTVLKPLTVATLAGWRTTQRVRHGLVQGNIQAPVAVLAMLHLIFMDFVPEPDLCSAALREPGQSLRCHGNAAGLLWQRPHFVHPTWLPLLPTTTRLIIRALSEPFPEKRLWQQVSEALRGIDPSYWPASAEGCKAALFDTSRAFLRLELPPSLLALADPDVPAPTLSEMSLLRLGEAADNSLASPAAPALSRARNHSNRSSDQDLNQLRKIITAHTSQTIRLGELRKRALDCLRQIRADVRIQSEFSAWLMDWVIDELQQSAEGRKGRLDISSISTYLAVLTRRPRALLEMDMDDPYEWSDDQWEHWIYALNTELTDGTSALSLGESLVPVPDTVAPVLHKRTKDAVGRLVRNLLHRQHWVPPSVRSAVADGDERLPCGSASSCLITDADLERSISIASTWLADQPLDALMLTTRARIQFQLPTRSSEISNLKANCLTSTGVLSIKRVGYKNIKNANSVRTLNTPEIVKELINDSRQELILYQPDAEFLFRGDGSPDAGRRDLELINLLSAAIKHATGDPTSRPHSLRASALQNMAWPDWGALASQILSANASPRSCSAWHEASNDWTRLAYAASAAGHGDLRAAMGNYLAGWNLVFAIRVTGLLDNTPPRPALLNQLNIDPAGLRKFRQRASTGSCEWGWVFSRITDDSIQELKTQLQLASDRDGISLAQGDFSSPFNPAHSNPSPPPSSSEQGTDNASPVLDPVTVTPPLPKDDLIYLSARILGMPKPQAIEKTGIGLARATSLDSRIPPDELIVMVSVRARAAAQERGRKGNQKALFSGQGREILDWVSSLDGQHLLTTVQFIYKLRAKDLSDQHMNDFWRKLFIGLPGSCALHIHRGRRYLGDAERSLLTINSELVFLTADDEVGEIPVIKLISRDVDNRVIGTRLNSVFRACLLARASLFGMLRHDV
jgi:hypothetical protein